MTSLGGSTDQYNTSDVQLRVGEGGYGGLSALVVWSENGNISEAVGRIFSGDIPPLPEPPSAE